MIRIYVVVAVALAIVSSHAFYPAASMPKVSPLVSQLSHRIVPLAADKNDENSGKIQEPEQPEYEVMQIP